MVRTLLSIIGAVAMALVTAAAHAQRGAGPGEPMGIAAGFQNAYNTMKRNVTQSAELVSEAGYASKPSTMEEVKTLRSGNRPRRRCPIQSVLGRVERAQPQSGE